MIEIISMIALLLVAELVTGKLAFMPNVKSIKDGHGRVRPMCKNASCGGYGDGWGSLKGFCTSCKHDADVGCKCKLYGCGEKYWTRVNPTRTHNMDGDLIS